MDTEDFWTKEIVLEKELSYSEYNHIRKSWGDCVLVNPNNTLAFFSNPIISQDYISLVDLFLEHPRAEKLKVYDAKIKRWHKYHHSQIDSDLADKLADIASKDKYGYNNFEMTFSPSGKNYDGVQKRAKINFRENDQNLIVCYELNIYRGNLDLFDNRLSENPKLIVSGICSLEDF